MFVHRSMYDEARDDLLSILVPAFVGRHKVDEIVHAEAPHTHTLTHSHTHRKWMVEHGEFF